ncbi:kinase-like domain-containing protein [Stachybotrys elegans]|uniref:Kinase-like domain-containing protein n=1 Tax=Stachybotrys elegans TaxID=80388 RepID=A0A8K0WX97_9HYPO|nr:kinase-like domain-containing protein [Stachybotrys elegans]
MPNYAHADFIDVLRAADQYGIPSLSLQHIGISDSDGDDKFARQVHPLGSGLTSQVIQHTTGPEAKDAVPVGTIVALKLFTMQAEKQHQPPKESSRAIFRLILREMEAFCHPMLSSHPNIVQLLFVGWQINNPFPILAMEMGVYGSLDHAIRKPGPGLTTAQKKHVSADIALGLHAIHEAGFVHGDLKPDNVILMPHQAHDRQLIAKIMDFGGSSKKSKGSKSSPAHITRLWCAPEVLNHDPDVDWEKADVYSFGLIFASIWGRWSIGGPEISHVLGPKKCAQD